MKVSFIEAFGPITPEQQARIDADKARVQRLRAFANLITLDPGEKGTEGSVNCAQCKYLGGFRADAQGGWCMALKMMVSTWHPVVCGLHRVPT